MNSVSPSVSNRKSAHSLSEDVVVKVDETSARSLARDDDEAWPGPVARDVASVDREVLGVDRVAVQVLLHLEGVLALHPLAHRARLGEEGRLVGVDAEREALADEEGMTETTNVWSAAAAKICWPRRW